MTVAEKIHRERLDDKQRTEHTAKLFGVRFLYLESMAFDTAASLSTQYDGGLWEFYRLSNQGFYLAPISPERFVVACDNGWDGEMSADALGLTACLYAYGLLAYSADPEFAQACARHYYLLRAFVMEHPEVRAILAATD